MFWRGKKLLRRHRVTLWITIIAVAVLGYSTYLTNSYAGRQIKTHYLQAFEKKYWAELDTFHFGSVAITRDYFNEIYESTIRLTSFGPAANAVANNDIATLTTIIEQQHDVNRLASGLFVLDRTGVVIAEKLDSDPHKLQLGTSAANQPYFKQVSQTKKPSASKVYYTQKDGAAAINFCAPFLTGEELRAIICNGIRLSALNTQLQEAALKTDYATYSTVITDIDGYVLFRDNLPPAELANIKGDQAVIALINGAENYKGEEVNYQNQEVFVESTRVNLGIDGGVFVLSYLPKAEAEEELVLLDIVLNQINTENGFRSLLLTLLACAVIYWVIRKHDEETTDH